MKYNVECERLTAGLTPEALLMSQQDPASKELEAWIREQMAVTNDLPAGQILLAPRGGDES